MPDDPSDVAATATSADPTAEDSPAARTSRPSLPRVIGARFHLGERIGAGGMGEVVAARDEQIGRDVAIKRMRAEAPSDRQVARFLREARVQGQLEHPAIPPVHELGRDVDGRPYFAMKKLAGVTLADVLDNADERFPRQRLLRAFADVCLAVEFAHTRGVVHRDLKPDNILLGEFGEVYVLDWGVAKLLGDAQGDAELAAGASGEVATVAGMAIGTPGYMSPEQVQGELDVDARSDVYALGCVLFEILAGQPLHPRGKAGMITAVEGVDGAPAKRAPDRDVPPELDELCVRATAHARGDRVATARELGDRVQQFLDGDRDLELRRGLAGSHLVRARAAFARDDRPTAMREAARALALDATLAGAGELVGRLMLEPPREVPPEVIAQTARDSAVVNVQHSRIILAGYVGYLAFLPVVLVRAPLGLGLAYAGLTALLVVWSWLVAFQRRPLPVVAFAVINFALIGVVADLFSSIAFAPTLAAMTAMVLALNPTFRTRPRTLSIVFCLAALGVPWLLGVAGVAARGVAIDDGGVHLAAPGLVGGGTLTAVVVVASLVVTSVVGVIVAYGIRVKESEARLAMRVQAWHLGLLVPDAATA